MVKRIANSVGRGEQTKGTKGGNGNKDGDDSSSVAKGKAHVAVLMFGQTGSGKTFTMTALARLAAGGLFRYLGEGGDDEDGDGGSGEDGGKGGGEGGGAEGGGEGGGEGGLGLGLELGGCSVTFVALEIAGLVRRERKERGERRERRERGEREERGEIEPFM